LKFKKKKKKHVAHQYLSETGDNDGYFKIHYKNGSAWLTVFPPRGEGKTVYLDEVIGRMKLLDIPQNDIPTVDKIISEATGRSEKIALWNSGAKLNAEIKATISEDQMTASITIIPPLIGGNEVTPEYIIESLHDYAIIKGIDKELINRICKNKLFKQELVIAKGNIPVPERGITLEYHFDANPGKPYLVDEQGRVNLKELNFIQPVEKGTRLVTIDPGNPGEPGYLVTGQPVEYQKLPAEQIRAGDGARLMDDNTIISEIDGHVTLKSGVISVAPVVVVDNVDYSTGNIDFNGAVQVRGSIADGFHVNATGTIEVGGFVGKSILKTTGDIILKAGMNGNMEGHVVTDGDIYARFFEGAKLLCHGNLYVEELIMHSHITVYGDIILKGRKAEVLGGKIVIGGTLWCKKLGSINGTETKVRIGVDPEKIALLKKLKKTIKHKKAGQGQINQKLNHIESLYQAKIHDKDKLDEAKLKLEIYQQRLTDELEHLEQEAKDISHLLTPSHKSHLVVENTVYNGTVIRYGKDEVKVTKDMTKTVFKYTNGSIGEAGYNSADYKITDYLPVQHGRR